MELSELREKIDMIDSELVRLVSERMMVAGDIAAYKREHEMPVLDARREREKLAQIADSSPENLKAYMRVLYSLIFELSRSYQSSLVCTESSLWQQITSAIEETPHLFPESCTCLHVCLPK